MLIKRVISGLCLCLFLTACSTQKLTIFYDDKNQEKAVKLENALSEQNLSIQVEVKPFDLFHEFNGFSLIYGANSDWELVANSVKEITEQYPTIYPAASSKHYYRSRQMGLYLLEKYNASSLYSCLSGKAFFELSGKLAIDKLSVTLFGETEKEDQVIDFSFEKFENGNILYTAPGFDSVIISSSDNNHRINWRQSGCLFQLRMQQFSNSQSSN